MKSKAWMAILTVAGVTAAGSAWACSTCGCSAAAKCPMATKAEPVKQAVHEEQGITTVSTDELKQTLAADEKVVLVDARSGKYDDGRRIGNAKQLAADSSEESITAALPDKDAKIVAYCTNQQCPASKALAHRLVDLGYKNVVKYPDGIEGWVDAGNEVKNPEK